MHITLKNLPFSESDEIYYKRYLGFAIQIFEEFPKKYEALANSLDIEQLKKERHGLLPTLKTLEFSSLLETLEEGKENLSKENISSQDMNENVSKVQNLCAEAVVFFQKELGQT
jgi:hypothetical protein